MLMRWYRRREPGWMRGLLINGLGTATTAVVAVVVGTSNFFQGSWLVLVLVPLLMLLLIGHPQPLPLDRRVSEARSRYRAIDETAAEPIVIVPVARLDRPARQAIAFANSISHARHGGPHHE